MKKILSILLSLSLLLCSVNVSFATEMQLQAGSIPEVGFSGMNDPNLLRYTEDIIYQNLVASLDSEEYFVENVSAVYISQEYIDELAYNSQANIYFGYTLQELSEQFQGKKYVFTLGDDGTTIVSEFEDYDDTYDRALKNVAIGTGVILVCVTVSVVSGGLGAPAVSMIFAASAKTGTIMALSGGTIGGISAGIVTGIQTGDMEQALKAAALASSEGYKWGAFSGTISGGFNQTFALKGATLSGLTMNEAAAIQRESKYPLDVIKQFKSMEQYKICRNAGLTPVTVNGKTSLIRVIDLEYVDELGRTNLQRMKQGLAAIDSNSGVSYELHHIGQKTESTLAILTKAEHMQGGNNTIWHEFGVASEVHNSTTQSLWLAQKQTYWKQLAVLMERGI
ncbi:MAG: hypothetical protein IKK34_00095 [Clostridia bacterium]|nr:hypothetical protein [Clostridia bacterium]